ncbi:hypothetical protein [Marinicauda pacifica]|uniref:hypothetical protein n=1 Tax=Marinicauda pacifica TaxID=1133559 RepID=UPI0035C7C30D
MSRSILINTVIENPDIESGNRIWYVAVAGQATLDSAMETLHELDRRLERDHIWGVIIDFRRLDTFPNPDDWTRFAIRVRLKLPAGLRSALIRGDHPRALLAKIAKAGHEAGASVKVVDFWREAAAHCGLAPDVADPLEDYEPLLVD